jgi:hypothetical protein
MVRRRAPATRMVHALSGLTVLTNGPERFDAHSGNASRFSPGGGAPAEHGHLSTSLQLDAVAPVGSWQR